MVILFDSPDLGVYNYICICQIARFLNYGNLTSKDGHKIRYEESCRYYNFYVASRPANREVDRDWEAFQPKQINILVGCFLGAQRTT